MESINDGNTTFIREQAEKLKTVILTEVQAKPGTELGAYCLRLQENHSEPAVRTALWDLISDRTITLERPNYKMHLTPPPANI